MCSPYSEIVKQFRGSVPVAALSLPKACTSQSVISEIYRQVAVPLQMPTICFDRERGFRVVQDGPKGVFYGGEIEFFVDALTVESGHKALYPVTVYQQPDFDSAVVANLISEDVIEFCSSAERQSPKHPGYVWRETSGGWVTVRYVLPQVNDAVMSWIWAFMRQFDVLGPKCLFILNNVQEYLEGSFRESDFGQTVRQGLFNIAEDLKQTYKRVILVGEHIKLDRFYGGQIFLAETKLPTLEQLETAFGQISNSLQTTFKQAGVNLEIALDAAQVKELCQKAAGLSLEEFGDALRVDATSRRKIDSETITLIQSRKIANLKLNGVDVVEPSEMKMPGGLANFKSWCEQRRDSFWMSVDTKQDDDLMIIEPPKGCLLLGLPGTGKSLSSKALGLLWNLPVLKLDLSAMKDSFVGQTGKNIRSALALAEAAAPCVLFVDEIDKGAAGASSDYQGDSGTSKELIGTFLTWMQERKAPVFTVLSANDCARLQAAHPELFRKGRLDSMFWFDLPNRAEIQEILSIYLKPQGADFSDAEMAQLTEACQGLVGAEIEGLVKDAVFLAVAAGRRKKGQLELSDLLQARQQLRPLAEQMKESLTRLRQWGQEYAIPASAPDAAPVAAVPATRGRKTSKQETGLML